MNLFVKQDLVLHSGKKSDFKIECDTLTDADIECLAYLISKKLRFSNVVGIAAGGLRLSKSLERYIEEDTSLPTLIADDVLTTGKSMKVTKKDLEGVVFNKVIGVVIFARGKCPKWVNALFSFW